MFHNNLLLFLSAKIGIISKTNYKIRDKS